MSAPRIDTRVSTDSEEFRARDKHNRALAEKLRADVAQAALGGTEKHRERHKSRGKLLPRERVERLLDPGSPFLDERVRKALSMSIDRDLFIRTFGEADMFEMIAATALGKETPENRDRSRTGKDVIKQLASDRK